MRLDGYWMNVKKPRDFLQGHALYLGHLAQRGNSDELSKDDAMVQGNVIIDPSAKVGAGCSIGPDVSIGPGCVVEEGVRLSRCILLKGVRVSAHSAVIDSILGWGASVGSWTRVEGISVLGEDAHA